MAGQFDDYRYETRRAYFSRSDAETDASSVCSSESSSSSRGPVWTAPTALELFSQARWNESFETAESAEVRLIERLAPELLPRATLAQRVTAERSVVPSRHESLEGFVRAYADVCERSERCARDASGCGRVEACACDYNMRCAGQSPAGAEREGARCCLHHGPARCSDESAGAEREGARCCLHHGPAHWSEESQSVCAPGCGRDARCAGQLPAAEREGARFCLRHGPARKNEESDETRESEGSAPGRGRGSARIDFETHVQRKLVGFLLSRVYEAIDFLGIVSYQDERGMISEEKKRRVVRVNEALTPWVKTLARVLMHAQLEKLDKFWKSQSAGERKMTDGGVTVYARVNLQSADMYIGETGSVADRTKQHFMACFRHSDRCDRRCRKCVEHSKYRRHRVCAPHAWLMVPLVQCDGKYEAKRLERCLITKWKPSLNQGDKPFWLLRNAYANDLRSARRQPRERVPPWRKEGVEPALDLPILTTYRVESANAFFDLGGILRAYAEKGTGVRITITPGQQDLTRWSRMRAEFGDSLVIVQRDEQRQQMVTVLKEWRHRGRASDGAFHIYVRPVAAPVEHVDREQRLAEVEEFAVSLERQDEESLAFFWRTRNTIDQRSRVKTRQLIWAECERRYAGLTRKPITVRIPYFAQLDGHAVKRLVHERIRSTDWPAFLQDWHCGRMRLITESQPSLEDILCNVNKPWCEHKGCKCGAVKERLRAAGYEKELKHIEGHVFFVGREYDGPCRAALNVCAANIPTQTAWDLSRAWERIHTQLPESVRGTATAWKRKLGDCQSRAELRPNSGRSLGHRNSTSRSDFPTTRDAYQLRKLLGGLVVGTLDKNKGELWACCPTLYDRALRGMYCERTGYEQVHVAKCSAYRKRMYTNEELPEQIIRTEEIADRRQRGTERDIVKLWARLYKQFGWAKYAAFNTRGAFNRPYVLFKAKNVVDPEVRRELDKMNSVMYLWKRRVVH